MRRQVALVVLWTSSLGMGLPQPVAAQAAASKSATLSTEINGFRLGMPIAEANRLLPLSRIPGGDQFEATTAGFSYNFGVTPKGRIYRIQSSQQLGRFEADPAFLTALGKKLTAKYGPPVSSRSGNFKWSLIQYLLNANGKSEAVETMWMSAYLSYDDQGKTLEMTLIDFRILWADKAAVNRKPSGEAAKKLQF